ncbi:MAG: CDP-ribitol ribitolphosphotransferase / teichoic acid ribitol-phosphate polymerase [Euryarchaeota archaeon]|nr:CDP-ribitol ribitolphosphotransferase / teichoic acid ribitol-phosphate polymerase [Euryarchaeota archaeon]
MNSKLILKDIKPKVKWVIRDIALFNLIYILYYIKYKLFKNNEKIVGFSSSHFNGELKYIFDKLENCGGVRLFFVSELHEELERLEKDSVDAYYCRDIRKIPLFVKTKVWVTSHGPYCIPDYYINMLLKRHNGKWVDTWHGVGVEEGSGEGRARMLSSYDMAFVPSEFYRDYYISKQDGLAEKLKVTGSPRTDTLINLDLSRQDAIKRLGLPQDKVNILYAPSWGNPAVGEKKEKCLFPYGQDDEMIERLNAFCLNNQCNFIIRPHPDWEDDNSLYARKIIKKIDKIERLFYCSLKSYPLTEPVLFATDVLITDYSSIANDFIVLNRPIIYLDKALPEDRFIFNLNERGGFVVKSDDEMMNKLQKILDDPIQSMKEISKNRERYARTIYKYVDGKASERCADEIMRLLQ